jgi:lipopolysaccharide transport system permease protein
MHKLSMAVAFGWRLLTAKYKGSFLGLGWLMLAPLASLAVYIFVFGEILKVKWPNAGQSSLGPLFEFGIMVFIGLSVFQFFSDSFNRACTVVTDNPNLVTKVVFPVEVLPVSTVFAAFFVLLFNLALCCCVVLAGGMKLGLSVLVLPILFLEMFLLASGFSFFLSALGVYFRDLSQLVGLLMGAMVFLIPVFFPASAFPVRFKFLVDYNPIAFYVESIRGVLISNLVPSTASIVGQLSLSLLVSVLGLSLFRILQKGFADVT